MTVRPSPRPSRYAQDRSTSAKDECMATAHEGYGTIRKGDPRPHTLRRQYRRVARSRPLASEFRSAVSLRLSENTLLMVEALNATIPVRRLHPWTIAGQTVITFG